MATLCFRCGDKYPLIIANCFFPQHPVGVIDPHFHRYEGSNYLLWKTDNNAEGGESAIFVQQLQVIFFPESVKTANKCISQEDGLAFKENTEAKMILRADLPEGITHYI